MTVSATIWRAIFLFVFALFGAAALSGCEAGPAEEAGEEIDDAAQDLQDSVDEAQEELD